MMGSLYTLLLILPLHLAQILCTSVWAIAVILSVHILIGEIPSTCQKICIFSEKAIPVLLQQIHVKAIEWSVIRFSVIQY